MAAGEPLGQCAPDKNEAASRRAWHERTGNAPGKAADIQLIETIDILRRSDRLDDPGAIDVRGNGKLDENAVDRSVGVQPFDEREKIARERLLEKA